MSFAVTRDTRVLHNPTFLAARHRISRVDASALTNAIAFAMDTIDALGHFWYHEAPRSVTGAAMQSAYRTYFTHLEQQRAALREQLPVALRAILDVEDETFAHTQQEIAALTGFEAILDHTMRAYLHWFEGALYWLTLLRDAPSAPTPQR